MCKLIVHNGVPTAYLPHPTTALLLRLEDHETDRLRVVGENEILKAKLKALCEQYEARDSHYTKQVLLSLTRLPLCVLLT